ncbi:pyridoxal phosphate-dependent aminotransferase [soil metagenome]
MIARGEPVANLTVGDFSPAEFRIPQFLADAIAEAVHAGETNYPPTFGITPLREAIRSLYARDLGLEYDLSSVIVASGARPIIYGAYRALVDPGERVVFPVPSWNNTYYCLLVNAEEIPVVAGPETAFLPTPKALRAALHGARLLVLNSPVNPTGTAFTAKNLAAVCDLVLEENARRGADERPLFVLYDQVYWMLTFGDVKHVTPVGLRPEMRPYTILADAGSKPFAATGIRVGWGVGPADLMGNIADVVSHAGAWAPRAEQVATAKLLNSGQVLSEYMTTMKRSVQGRLDAMYSGCMALRSEGLPVDAIEPRGAIYLSARFALHGRRTADGETLRADEDVRRFLLRRAGVAVIPFEVFGYPDGSGWCRLSAGAVSISDVQNMFPRLRAALAELIE